MGFGTRWLQYATPEEYKNITTCRIPQAQHGVLKSINCEHPVIHVLK